VGYDCLVNKWDNNGQREWLFRPGAGGGDWEFRLFDESVDVTRGRYTGTVLTTAQWYHIVGTYNGDETDPNAGIDIYVNGVVSDTTNIDTVGTYTAMENSTGKLFFGAIEDTSLVPYRLFDGKIDDVRIYNRELSQAEVTQLYDSYNPGIAISSLQKGLVGHWKMNGTSEDSTPNSNDGAVTGASLTTDRKSQANKAYSFNGTTDYMLVSDDSAIQNIFDGGGTVSMWISADSDGELDTGRIFDNAVSYLNTQNESGGAVKLRFIRGFSTTAGIWVTDNAVVSIGSWTHVVMTYDNGNVANNPTIYVNGVSVAATETQTPIGTRNTSVGNNLYIGSETTVAACFDGKIDDFRFYNRVLSQTEITSLYDSYNPGIAISSLQKGLIGYWELDGTVEDATPYSNDGTNTGADITSDRKGQSSKSYDFVSASTDNVTLGTTLLDDRTDGTVSMWLKPATNGVTDATKPYWNTTILNKGLVYAAIQQMSDNKIRIYYYGTPTAWSYFDSVSSVTVGSWNHIAYTWISGDSKLYINGVEDATSALSWTHAAASGAGTTLTLGGTAIEGADYFFNGTIDDLRIYDRVLSATEITRLYQSYF